MKDDDATCPTCAVGRKHLWRWSDHWYCCNCGCRFWPDGAVMLRGSKPEHRMDRAHPWMFKEAT